MFMLKYVHEKSFVVLSLRVDRYGLVSLKSFGLEEVIHR